VDNKGGMKEGTPERGKVDSAVVLGGKMFRPTGNRNEDMTNESKGMQYIETLLEVQGESFTLIFKEGCGY